MTGSQGEPLAALSRISRGEHQHVRLKTTDTVIFSASPIPGNTISVVNTIDRLMKLGAKVVYGKGENIHVLKGGIVEFFNDIGWNMMELAEMQNPQREMFACFAEAMILEFEKCHTNFSWGRNNISLEKMEYIGAASLKHGFSAIGLDKQPKILTV